MKNEKRQKEIRYIDIFGGVGGFRLGIENASKRQAAGGKKGQCGKRPDKRSNRQPSFRCVWYCDFDRYAVQVYNRNFSESYKPTDITAVRAEDIPDFDLLCAGFPCQAFSIAGKRKGFKDTRGTLFFEICRIAKEKKPRFLFLENVKGLLNHGKGETFKVIIKTLVELGYDIQWQVLNSKHFEVPQNRERVFIVGYLRGTSRPKIFPLKEDDKRNNEKQFPRKKTNERENIKDNKDWRRCSLPNIRRLTPVECEKLQGFPTNWTAEGINEKGEIVKISDTQRYKMCGNAVTVNVIEAIIRNWLESIDKHKEK